MLHDPCGIAGKPRLLQSGGALLSTARLLDLKGKPRPSRSAKRTPPPMPRPNSTFRKVESFCTRTEDARRVTVDSRGGPPLDAPHPAGDPVAKYLLKVSYNAEGIKGVMKEGDTSRVAAVTKALSRVGESLKSFSYAFGSEDVDAIADVPDRYGPRGNPRFLRLSRQLRDDCADHPRRGGRRHEDGHRLPIPGLIARQVAAPPTRASATEDSDRPRGGAQRTLRRCGDRRPADQLGSSTSPRSSSVPPRGLA